jgi:hypothetical protein
MLRNLDKYLDKRGFLSPTRLSLSVLARRILRPRIEKKYMMYKSMAILLWRDPPGLRMVIGQCLMIVDRYWL